MNLTSDICPQASVLRPRWPALLLCLPFVASIAFAYLWFNTDLGRPSSGLRPPSSGIWLTARTNLPGYTFVEEPVSDEVKKILGTTNIFNGTFHRILEVRGQKSKRRSVFRKLTLTESPRVFL